MLQSYAEAELLDARKIDTGGSNRYRVNLSWLVKDWEHSDGRKIKGRDMWGKTKPCIPGSLFCKCCCKQVQYGNWGK